MFRISILSFFLFLGLSIRAEIPQVPASMNYCGMDLYITPGAQEKMNSVIRRLHQSPTYYNLMADRVMMYMPFVEDAFGLIDVPNDLKYICILESGMIGDAVSPSNAVGFWQFKDFTGRAMGLLINDKIDERKHIWRSSFAAAHYFHQLNGVFDNWIYAIIGYNQGASGAMPFTHKDYYGKRKMIITEDIHPYAMKAIAFTVAFKPVLAARPDPPIRLKPISNRGEISVISLAEKNGIDLKTFKDYNLWIRHITLPEYPPFTYYIPANNQESDRYADPHLPLYGREKSFVSEIEKEINAKTKKIPSRAVVRQSWESKFDSEKYKLMDFASDPDYGRSYVILEEGKFLIDIAEEKGIRLKKLRKWNGIKSRPDAGSIVYLKSPKKLHYHIAKEGETPWSISKKHRTDAASIAVYNEVYSVVTKLEAGRKIYLRLPKPKDEKITILGFQTPPNPAPAVSLDAAAIAANTRDNNSEALEDPVEVKVVPTNYFRVPEPAAKESTWISHTVGKGETLWAIYKLYGMRVEMIRKVNDLTSDALKPGQKLRIMVR